MGGNLPTPLSGIVLCGGLSRRMGQDKASLLWDGRTLLGHVVETLQPLVSEVLVVARSGQGLPREISFRISRGLPVHSARVVTDRIPGAGPLGGLEAGLAAIETSYGIVVACDMPWLDFRLLQTMAALSPGWDLVIPRLFGRYQPLHAVYAKRLQPVAADLLKGGECRVHALVDRVKARVLDEAFLRTVDPSLRSVRSLDDRESYEEATALALQS